MFPHRSGSVEKLAEDDKITTNRKVYPDTKPNDYFKTYQPRDLDN